APSASVVPTAAPTVAARLKRITLGTLFVPDLRPSAPSPARVMQPLVSSGLSVSDVQGTLYPLLAQRLPNLDNGLWVLNGDGTMRTTYLLRPNAAWHDGTPLTADDLQFSLEVGRDP